MTLANRKTQESEPPLARGAVSLSRPAGCGCPPALMPVGWRAPSGFAAPTGPLVSPPRHQAGRSRFYELPAARGSSFARRLPGSVRPLIESSSVVGGHFPRGTASGCRCGAADADQHHRAMSSGPSSGHGISALETLRIRHFDLAPGWLTTCPFGISPRLVYFWPRA